MSFAEPSAWLSRGLRRRERARGAVGDLRDRVGDAAQDLRQRHRLVVVIADVHRVPAEVDRVGGQRRR